jgi:hydrogenase expression/formation protein HypC
MCLAVPGRILAISNSNTDSSSNPNGKAKTSVSLSAGASSVRSSAAGEDDLWRMAEVDFGGVRQQVSLACLPQARVGDRVLVHVGFALSLVDDELEPSP